MRLKAEVIYGTCVSKKGSNQLIVDEAFILWPYSGGKIHVKSLFIDKKLESVRSGQDYRDKIDFRVQAYY